MNIKHNSIFDVEKIAETYTKKDGVDVSYVCTTDLNNSDIPADVFYRSTPHPQFGNRYFGILYVNDQVMITNADKVENYIFGMVENDNGELEYSESHHLYKHFKNGNMIDGGRQYVRSNGNVIKYKIKDGQFVFDMSDQHRV